MFSSLASTGDSSITASNKASEFEWSEGEETSDIEHADNEEEQHFSEAELKEIVEWDRIKPKEYRTGETGYKIVDNFGEKRITLTSKCDDGERIRILVKMPEDGHAYIERDLYLYITLMAENGNRQKFHVQAFSGLGHFDCYGYATEREYYDVENTPEILKRRGINMSLEIFLREYMIDKFVKEKLIPNIKHGY